MEDLDGVVFRTNIMILSDTSAVISIFKEQELYFLQNFVPISTVQGFCTNLRNVIIKTLTVLQMKTIKHKEDKSVFNSFYDSDLPVSILVGSHLVLSSSTVKYLGILLDLSFKKYHKFVKTKSSNREKVLRVMT